jgi:hypothetical protein
MRVGYFHCRDFQRAGDIVVKRIPTRDNPADFFTKNTGNGKLASAIQLLAEAASLTDPQPGLMRCLYGDKTPADPLPDTPTTIKERRLLQSDCEDPYIELNEVDREAEDDMMLRGQAATSIRGAGHAAEGQGYAY